MTSHASVGGERDSYNSKANVVQLINFTMHTMNVLLKQTFPFANAQLQSDEVKLINFSFWIVYQPIA